MVFAVVVEEAAACSVGDDLEDGEVPGFAGGFEPDFGGPGADEHGVHGAAEAADGPELAHEIEEDFGVGDDEAVLEAVGAEDGFADIGDVGVVELFGASALAAPGAEAADAPVDFFESGEGGDTDFDDAIDFEGDEIGPEAVFADEVAGAVDGVNDPAAAAGGFLGSAFLAEESVVRKGGGETGDEEFFGFAVGDGDRGVVGLVLGGDALAHIVEGLLAGTPGEIAGDVEFTLEGHHRYCREIVEG